MNNLMACLTRKTRHNYGGKVKTLNGPYYYHDYGNTILGVAHLDHVMFDKPVMHNHHTIACPQLDDRLGVWLLLHQLPKMGVNLDVLLTTNEERMSSTGYYFDTARKYKWIVEFDRAGEDVVFYQYQQWADLWDMYGFKPAYGSYSDIADLGHLGVMAANVGIGYHQQHTKNCFADLRQTGRQIKKFAQFWQDNKDIEYPFVPEPEVLSHDEIWENYKKDPWGTEYVRDKNGHWVTEYDIDAASEYDLDAEYDHVVRKF